ncbi:MAG: DNA pilot protein [Microvirus sp.]|nr:MAG: DNA pilot protein [Microvirus sp.]
MGFFKKVKKFVKKAAPIALGAAGAYYGGPALAGMLGGGAGVTAQDSLGPGESMAPPGPNELPRVNVNGKTPFNWDNAIGIGTAGLSYLGGVRANNANAKQAQNQMDFQAQQTGTAYQRATADMQAAGLNPMLAYSQGGASSGSGAQADIGNPVDAALSTARQSYQMRETMRGLKLSNDNTEAQNSQILAQTANTEQQTRNLAAENPNYALTGKNLEATASEAAQRTANLLQDNDFRKLSNPEQIKAIRQQNLSAFYNLAGEKNTYQFNKNLGDLLPGGSKTAGAITSTAKGAFDLVGRGARLFGR